ncbi:ArgS-related anticodon-binding protein NrtL [Streptomyces sp. NPDC018045]|uniref:ArgS-related anticodon-binding protein NrtL n=1 Tax=Streptomyces sp. NPDC018045 TaxID=3365037 RepID=UPI0037ADE881
MTPAELSRAVLRSVRGAVADGELSVTVPERVVVRAPTPGEGGGGGGEADLACTVALQVAKEAGRPPREVAEPLRRRLAGLPGIAAVEIAGAGFLNVTLTGTARAELVRDVLAQGREYGCAGEPGTAGQGRGGASVALRAAAGVRAAVVVEALERILPAGGMGGAAGTGDEGAARGEAIRPRGVEMRFGQGAPQPAGPSPRGEHPGDVAAHEWRVLTARLGADEARWVLLRAAQQDAVRLPERPVQRESNGRFRVQYAYARTCAMTRNARELGFTAEPGDTGDGRAAREVWAAVAEYPGVVEAAARHRAPDRVARHLEVTADAWLRCHDGCPPLPVGEEKPSAVHRARLALAEAAGTVLANGLHLLGISTPERL